VILLSNYDLAKVYHKALDKDMTAIDSLLTRVEVIQILEGEPLDIDGFREALAQASLATTVIPTTSEVVKPSNAPTSPSPAEQEVNNSTIETPGSTMESAIFISTPPPTKSSDSTTTSRSSRYEIDEEDFIYAPEPAVEKSDHQKIYEKFQQERREQLRKKQRKEDAFERLEKSRRGSLFTGYN